MSRGKAKTHAEDDVHVIYEAHAYDLDGHPMSFVCTPQYVSKAPASGLYSIFRAVRDVHGLWDDSMSAACFTKFVEQLLSFPI